MATEANAFYTQKPPPREKQSEAGDAKVQKKTDSKRQKGKSDSKPKQTVETVKAQEKQEKEKSKAKAETSKRRKDSKLAKKAIQEVEAYKVRESTRSKIKVTGKPGSGLNKVTEILELHPERPKRKTSKEIFKETSSLTHLQSFVEARKTGEIDLVNDKVQGKSQPDGASTREDTDIFDIALDIPQPPVPNLSFGLDRVLFK